MIKINKQTIFLSTSLILLSACGGGSDGSGGGGTTSSTPIQIFDGAAISCSVTALGLTAKETGQPGEYTIAGTLEAGEVVTAKNCIDSDTNAQLPTMTGVAQVDGVIISPITTLIVASALSNTAPNQTRISSSDLNNAITKIITNLKLGSYNPIDPATANYVASAKADTTGNSTAAVAMKIGLALSTLLKSVEIASGQDDSTVAIKAIAETIVNAINPIDFKLSSDINNMMSSAATAAPAVANAINAASNAIAETVSSIAGTIGPINIAISITASVSDILNNATETSIADPNTVSALTTAIANSLSTSLPNCVLGESSINGCKL